MGENKISIKKCSDISAGGSSVSEYFEKKWKMRRAPFLMRVAEVNFKGVHLYLN